MLESAVFLLEQSEPANLVHRQSAILLLPAIVGLLGDPELADQIAYRHPELYLLERRYNLLD